jgi:hypothetical protein
MVTPLSNRRYRQRCVAVMAVLAVGAGWQICRFPDLAGAAAGAAGWKAEGVGFEPTEAFTSLVFKTRAINHSTTPPGVDPQGQNHCPTGFDPWRSSWLRLLRPVAMLQVERCGLVGRRIHGCPLHQSAGRSHPRAGRHDRDPAGERRPRAPVRPLLRATGAGGDRPRFVVRQLRPQFSGLVRGNRHLSIDELRKLVPPVVVSHWSKTYKTYL